MSLAKVLLVEDDHFVQTALHHALAGANFDVLEAVSTVHAALQFSDLTSVEVAILDLDLGPGANGIDLAFALRKIHPKIGLVILTSYSDPRISDPNTRSLPRGTIFLTKSKISDLKMLMSAILSAKKSPLHTGRKNAPLLDLSDKQIQVLILLSQGMTTSEIARQQQVGEKAIEAAITKLHKQLALTKSRTLNPRVQLVRAYLALRGKDI